MMPYGAARTDVSRLIDGPRLGNGDLDPDLENELMAGYVRAFFFCPPLRFLTGQARTINREASRLQASGDLPAHVDLPSVDLLTAAIDGRMGVSLEGLLRINAVLGVIGRRGSPLAKSVAATILRDDALPDRCIKISMHHCDVKTLQSIREEAGYSDRVAFSEKLYQGVTRLSGPQRYIVSYLEDGYKDRERRGEYKVTAAFAAEFLKQVSTLLPKTQLRLDGLFTQSARMGTRNGHSSRALPLSMGNLLP